MMDPFAQINLKLGDFSYGSRPHLAIGAPGPRSRLPPCLMQSGNLGPGDWGSGAMIATLSLQNGDQGPGDWGPRKQGWGPNRLEPLAIYILGAIHLFPQSFSGGGVCSISKMGTVMECG